MKNLLIFIAILVVLTGLNALFLYSEPEEKLKHEIELGGVKWPVGTVVEKDTDENVIFTLTQKMEFAEGKFPAGTKVYFEEDKIFGLEIFHDFEFADFQFLQGAKIAFKTEEGSHKHIIELTEKREFDGLPLKKGCLVKFRDYVLDAATCPEYEDVHFKRKISLPEAGSND